MTRKLYDKYNKRAMRLEKTAVTDNVDRSGYIPLDLQYARLMSAGKKLEEVRDYEYNVDLKRLEEALKSGKVNVEDFYSPLFKNNLDKVELDSLLKDKLEKASKQKDINKEYNRLMEDFKQSERDKEIRQQAINEYKQILDNSIHSNPN